MQTLGVTDAGISMVTSTANRGGVCATDDVPGGMGMSDKKILTALCPGGSNRMTRIFRLMSTEKVDPTPMTTHVFGFDEVPRAFELMSTKEEGIIKPLIRFS